MKRIVGFTSALVLAFVGSVATVGAAKAPRPERAQGVGALEIVDSGFTVSPGLTESDKSVDGAAVFKNTSDKVAVGVEYEYVIADPGGKKIETSSSQKLRYLLPGEETFVVVDEDLFDIGSREVGDVKFRFTAVDEFVKPSRWETFQGNPDAGVEPADLIQFSDVRATQGDVFDNVFGLATNTSDKLLSLSPFAVAVSCAVFRDGDVVGGAYEQLAVLPPGTPVAVLNQIPQEEDPDEVRCSAQVNAEAVVPVDSDAASFQVLETNIVADPLGDLKAAARIATTADAVPTDVTADWEFVDAAGQPIGNAEESFTVPYLVPGDELVVAASPEPPDRFVGVPASVIVRVAATQYLSPSDFKDQFGFAVDKPPFSVTAVEHSLDGAVLDVTGTVESTAKRDLEGQVECGISAGTAPLGYAVAINLVVPGKGSVPFEADTGAIPGGVTDVSCVGFVDPFQYT